MSQDMSQVMPQGSSQGLPQGSPQGFKLPKPVFPLDDLREKGYLFYEKEILSTQAAHVQVQGHGQMVMLSSYSYLGLLHHPTIDHAASQACLDYGTGTHGVRLLAGTCPLHLALESAIAHLKGTAAAVTLSSGYVTNMAAITALVGRNDVVLCDTLNHASIVDGCTLSGAQCVRFKHNNLDDLQHHLDTIAPHKNVLVVVDAVFSMDGDIVDLPRLSHMCKARGALLMVDEAHSLGVLGATGTGIEAHFGCPPGTIDVKMGTLSKTIPSVGGYIAGTQAIVDLIRYRSRPYIFSAALPPPSAAAALAAIQVMQAEPWRVTQLHANTAYFIAALKARGLNTMQSTTAIVPVLVGQYDRAFKVAQYCQQHQVFVQCIAQPAVAKGLERLRCIVMASHTQDDLDLCVDVIGRAMQLHGA